MVGIGSKKISAVDCSTGYSPDVHSFSTGASRRVPLTRLPTRTYPLNFMKCRRIPAVTLLFCALALGPALAADPWTNESFLHRVFLDDGTSLASFGEPAQLGDRVVFSMPTAASATEPHLHLVTIPASRVDWNRTNSYAESVRAAQYL